MTPHLATAPGKESPRRAIVVFARAPQDEQRAKPLAPQRVPARAEPATRLHRALVQRTLGAAARVSDADVLLVTTSDLAHAEREARRSVPAARLRVWPQVGGSFVARLEHAAHQAFAAGYEHVVIVGSDTPELDQARLGEAFARLQAGAPTGATAVLGPATDGGYYLLGLTAFSRAPFAGIDLGGAEVAAQTQRALAQAGYAVSLLVALPDIDTSADLGRVAARLRARGRPSDAPLRLLLLDLLAAEAPRAPWPTSFARLRDPLAPRDARGPPLP